MVDGSIGVVGCFDSQTATLGKKFAGSLGGVLIVGELSQPEPRVNPGPKTPLQSFAILLQPDSPQHQSWPISALSMQKEVGT